MALSDLPSSNSIFQYPPNFPNGEVAQAWLNFFQSIVDNAVELPTPITGDALGWDNAGNLINVANTGASQTAAWTAADAAVTSAVTTAYQAADSAAAASLAATGGGQGAALVGYIAPYTGAVATTQSEYNSRIINLMDTLSAAQKADIAAGTATVDCTTAFNDAIVAAKAMVHGAQMLNPAGPAQIQGGAIIQLPPGRILLSSLTTVSAGLLQPVTASIILYDSIQIRGAGVNSTTIYSTANGPVIANAQTNYGSCGMGVSDLTIQGGISNSTFASSFNSSIAATSMTAGQVYTILTTGTSNFVTYGANTNTVGCTFMATGVGAGTGTVKASQVGLWLARDWWGNYHDLVIRECGSHAVYGQELLDSQFTRLNCYVNYGDGFRLDAGTQSPFYPCIGVLNNNGFFAFNGGLGINLVGKVYGCQFVGGGCQNNQAVYGGSGSNSFTIAWPGTTNFTALGAANNNIGTTFTASGAWSGTGLASASGTGTGVGYSVEISCASTIPNEFDGYWFEGSANAYIHMNATNVGDVVHFVRLHHAGAGTTGNVNRCIINDKGTVLMDDAFGNANLYASMSGSTAPFRVNVGGAAAAYRAKNIQGCTLTTSGPWFETETHSTTATGLLTAVLLDQPGLSYKVAYGAGVAAASTIAVPNGTSIFHVGTSTTPIVNITPPANGWTGTIYIIPDTAFTTTTAGNIGIASTAVVGKVLVMTYDGTATGKWWPSY